MITIILDPGVHAPLGCRLPGHTKSYFRLLFTTWARITGLRKFHVDLSCGFDEGALMVTRIPQTYVHLRNWAHHDAFSSDCPVCSRGTWCNLGHTETLSHSIFAVSSYSTVQLLRLPTRTGEMPLPTPTPNPRTWNAITARTPALPMTGFQWRQSSPICPPHRV